MHEPGYCRRRQKPLVVHCSHLGYRQKVAHVEVAFFTIFPQVPFARFGHHVAQLLSSRKNTTMKHTARQKHARKLGGPWHMARHRRTRPVVHHATHMYSQKGIRTRWGNKQSLKPMEFPCRRHNHPMPRWSEVHVPAQGSMGAVACQQANQERASQGHPEKATKAHRPGSNGEKRHLVSWTT